MSDDNDPYQGSDPVTRPFTGPEQWLGGPDPLHSFGTTVEQALHRLTLELAGLRAERDGMRLELEGLRTQLQLTQEQLGDRERFTATVRELSQIVSQLTLPPRWAPPPPVPVYQPIVDPYVSFAPPQGYATPQAAPVPPAAPTPSAPAADDAPALELPAPVVPPAPPAPEPMAEVAEAAPLAPSPAPVAPQPSAVDEPTESIPLGGASTSVVEPGPSPAPAMEAIPEPSVQQADPLITVPRSSGYQSEAYQQIETGLEAKRESFFGQAGTWYEAPPKAGRRRTTFKTWARRIGTGVGGLIVSIILLVSIGPKVLPYQTYFVRSGSMSPTFNTGDLIVLGKVDASDLKQGDIITFDRPDKPGTLVTHRIASIETGTNGKVFTTKGDANNDVDPWKVPATGSGWKYSRRVPTVGFVFGYLGTPQARLMLLIIPAVLLGLLSLLDIWKPKPKAPARRGR